MFKSYAPYSELKEELIEDIEEGYILKDNYIYIVRDKKKVLQELYPVIDYSNEEYELIEELKDNEYIETIKARELLKEFIYYSSPFNLATLKEYGIVYDRDEGTLRHRCLRGSSKTAIKVNGGWFIDIYEELKDYRINTGKYIKNK